jgi:hypothetical protein
MDKQAIAEKALSHANDVRQCLNSAMEHVAGVENAASDVTDRLNEAKSRLDNAIQHLDMAFKAAEPKPLTITGALSFLLKECARRQSEATGEDYGELTTHLFSLAQRLLKEVETILSRVGV